MKKSGFIKWNEKANYYSKVQTWDKNGLNGIQEDFIDLIKNCDLTVQQLEAISSFLVLENASLGGKGKNTSSIEKFELIKDSLLKPNSKWIEEIEEETRKRVA